MGFGERLKILREEMKLSQEALGQQLNLRRATIIKYERGSEELEMVRTLIAMSNLFNVPVDYLLGLTDCAEKYPAAEPVEVVDLEQILIQSAKTLTPKSQKSLFEYVNALKKKDDALESDDHSELPE